MSIQIQFMDLEFGILVSSVFGLMLGRQIQCFDHFEGIEMCSNMVISGQTSISV